jgi:hypothetical protein
VWCSCNGGWLCTFPFVCSTKQKIEFDKLTVKWHETFSSKKTAAVCGTYKKLKFFLAIKLVAIKTTYVLYNNCCVIHTC